ncbi:MAG: hypothetical protein LBP42_00965, partial [Treponema sp.]|nr:hypothetical protein [Treponema sp.]
RWNSVRLFFCVFRAVFYDFFPVRPAYADPSVRRTSFTAPASWVITKREEKSTAQAKKAQKEGKYIIFFLFSSSLFALCAFAVFIFIHLCGSRLVFAAGGSFFSSKQFYFEGILAHKKQALLPCV